MSLKRILVVQFYERVLKQHNYWLSHDGHGVTTFLAKNEPKIRERILEEVAQINPQLLIIAVRPSPFPGSDWGRKSAVKFPIGLETVELLRQTSNIPIILTHRWYGDLWSEQDYWDSKKDYWDRIEKTHPVAVVRGEDFDELQLAARLAEQINESMESAQLFSTVFDAASDALFIKDTSLRYTRVNPAMQVLFSRPASELVGKTDDDLFEPDIAEHLKELEQRVLQGESKEEEYSRPINGVLLTFLDSRVPLRGASGEIIGICGYSRDITDRQRIFPQKVTIDSKGSAPAKRNFVEAIHLAAESSSTVLLLGESGSGKDFVARYIHDHSDRSNGQYFSINCAAIAPHLAESELFGHEKGAFTGAAGRKRGMLELAEGGTLLLNEIGDLSLPLQAKLLTFLDTKRIMRVGGQKEISVNARLMAATNRDLKEGVESGGFRKDLFYRLNVLSIRVLPLRNRIEDLPVIVQELLVKLRESLGHKEALRISGAALAVLAKYHWPGNVRELKNVLERALILSKGGMIQEAHLLLAPEGEVNQIKKTDDHKSDVDGDTQYFAYLRSLMWPEGSKRRNPLPLPSEELRQLEEEYHTRRGWSIAKIARELGIDASTLHKRLYPRKPNAPPAS